MKRIIILLALLLMPVSVWGQVSSSTTRRIRGGTSLPATCRATNPVDVFVKTDATAATRVYICTSANTWTAQGGTGTVTGTGANTRVAFWTSASALSSDTGLIFDAANDDLTIGRDIIATRNFSGVGLLLSGTATITSNSATALTVGPNGASGPTLQVDSSTASAINGVKVAGAATGGTPSISAVGTDSNISLALTPKGSGWTQLSAEGIVLVGVGGPQIKRSGNYFDVGVTSSPTSVLIGGNQTAGDSGLFLESDGLIKWATSGAASSSSNNAGLAKSAAGVVLVTDGSTGWGKLLRGRVVTAKTTDYTVTANEVGAFFTNAGAGAGVIFTLPTPVVGMEYEFYRDANQAVTVDIGGSVTIQIGASVTTAGGNVTLDAVGSRIRIVAISTTQWVGDVTGAATFN